MRLLPLLVMELPGVCCLTSPPFNNFNPVNIGRRYLPFLLPPLLARLSSVSNIELYVWPRKSSTVNARFLKSCEKIAAIRDTDGS